MLNTYLPMALHELRSQLHVMNLISELLQRTLQPGNHTALFRSLLDSNDHLRRLADDLIDVSRLEAGRFDLAPVETDLHRLLNGVVDDAALLVEQHGPDVSLRLGSDLPERVLTDPNRLRQVLANLLSNAIKFTPSGSVSLGAHLHGMAPHRVGWLTFTVKDSGPGIALGEQLAVFEPFAARSGEAKQGSGLGLAISRQISNQMGGTLRLESTGPGGSVFEVFVPVGVVN